MYGYTYSCVSIHRFFRYVLVHSAIHTCIRTYIHTFKSLGVMSKIMQAAHCNANSETTVPTFDVLWTLAQFCRSWPKTMPSWLRQILWRNTYSKPFPYTSPTQLAPLCRMWVPRIRSRFEALCSFLPLTHKQRATYIIKSIWLFSPWIYLSFIKRTEGCRACLYFWKNEQNEV